MGYAVEEWQQHLFSPGQTVPAGQYLRVDVETGRVVMLSQEGMLPASLDGRVAAYVRLEDVGLLGQQLTSRDNIESPN